MTALINRCIGILAYGSLIDDPGTELIPLINERIPCQTPFAVEYARLSSTRDNAPTLIPVEEGGNHVNAQLLLLRPDISVEQAEDILWRRETRQKDLQKPYPRTKERGKNAVQIIRLSNFEGVDQVIYTSIPSNIGISSPNILAGLAIQSILKEAGGKGLDGVRYLLNAKRHGIHTPLTDDYEKEILKFTGTVSLEAAIEKLDAERPIHLKRAAILKVFEEDVIKIADLICEYGLKKTLGGGEVDLETFKEYINDQKDTFIINIHEGFKKAQEKILVNMLSLEEENDRLIAMLKTIDRKKDKVASRETKEQINTITHQEQVLRHLIDTIAWQLIKGQLYIARRLYHGVKGKKRLLHSNIQSVIRAAKELNASPMDFALITDLSAYIQTGDILLKKGDGSLVFIEVKEGKVNHEILKIMDGLFNLNKPAKESCKNLKPDSKIIHQLDRNLKQFGEMLSLAEILNTDKGTDSSGMPVKIITPKEETPYFRERLSALYEQLQTRNMWAYDVIDECLHIGIYKGPFKSLGPLILKSLGEQHGGNYIIIDFISIIRSLHKPLLFLPFPKSFLFDILFGRIKLFFMVNLDQYMTLFAEFGMKAEWLSRRETMKVVEGQKDHGIFIYKNRAISVTEIETKQKSILSTGIFGKLFYEHIYPSYTAYSLKYFLDPQLA